MADESQLIQVFSNLFSNALYAMPDGGKLTISGEKKTDFIELYVVDNGEGISEDEIDKIFEPLFSTKPQGTGLGLSICQSIIEMHKGSIKVRSKPGEETKVTIRLPIS